MLNRSLSPTFSQHSQSLSLSTLQFPNGGVAISGNNLNGIIPSATDEILKLRKEVILHHPQPILFQLRLKEADYNKDKALLQQRVEQLEQQIRDFREREETQKKVYESMINCLNNNTGDPNNANAVAAANQALLQIQAAEKQAQAEIQELQQQKRRIYDELEYKEKQYQRQICDKDLFIKDIQHTLEKANLEKRQQIFQFDQEKKELYQKISNLQSEKDSLTQKLELKYQTKNNELQLELDKVKLDYQRESERMKSEFEQALKEIKYFHEQEKLTLQTKVERSHNELSSLFQMVKQKGAQQENEANQSVIIMRRREELEAEVTQLHDEVEQIKKQYEKDVSQLTKDKATAEERAQKISKQLEKIKNAPKPVKIDLSSATTNDSKRSEQSIANMKEEIEGLIKENDKLNDQLKRFRKEMLENQDYIEKIEQNERKLRQALKEKGNIEHDSDKIIEVRKQLNYEKKRNIELQEQSDKLKDQVECLKDQHLNEMLEKDQKIIKLSKELRDTERKLQDIQSVFNSNQASSRQQRNLSPFTNQDISQIHGRNASYSPIQQPSQHQHSYQNFQISPRGNHQHNQSNAFSYAPMQEGQQSMKQISQLELTLLRTCQRMADSAIRMECATCMQIFETADFYDHIIQDHPTNSNKTIPQSQHLQQSNYQYNTNKNQHNAAVKRYAEDLRSSSQNYNILSTSPKINPNQTQKQQHNPPRWIHSSRSFTCLLNEIEEEEKQPNQSNISQLNFTDNTSSQKQLTSVNNDNKKHKFKSKSPINQQKDQTKDESSMPSKNKSRNMINTQQTQNESIIQLNTQGNTIQSIVKSQKEQKKLNQQSNLSTSRVHSGTQVMTACRTEIQNLKRQNKQLSNQLQEQESKIQDVSRDCSKIKKQVKKEQKQADTNLNSSRLTNEIKGLLEKLVTYQANSNKDGGGSYTSRQQLYPMSMDSMVELRSSAASSNQIKESKKKSTNKANKNHKDNKSPMNTGQVSGTQKHKHSTNGSNHHSNKENVMVQKKVPKLQIQTIKEHENHDSNSSNEKIDEQTTERRYHNIKKSGELCSNSPRRYQNYFEILQSIDETSQNEQTQKIRRFSPTSEQMKFTYVHKQAPSQVTENSRNLMPQSSKLFQQNTVTSSGNNLVLYDSSNNDTMFKSKNTLQQFNFQKQKSTTNITNNVQVKYDRMTLNDDNEDEYLNNNNNMPSSSCPSLDEYEENQILRQSDMFNSSADEDPFITGRFCDNAGQGKQFQFKYSGNNSKNTTMRSKNFINQ